MSHANGSPLVLVVEDEAIMQEILVDILAGAGFEVVTADSGLAVREAIARHGAALDVILLDRLLPDMDTLTLMPEIKSNPDLEHVPVIIQTSMVDSCEVAAGLAAGAYYYLPKPFPPETVLAIVRAAWRDRADFVELRQNLNQAQDVMRHLQRGEFSFRTQADARQLSTVLAYATPEPARVVLGLTEIMLNAVEHGNLEISYDEKSALLADDVLSEEIERRLAAPAFAARQARITIECTPTAVTFTVRDEGKGFAWENYLEISPDRAFHTHGRGIAMARLMSFDAIEYRGCGNEVVCRIDLNG